MEAVMKVLSASEVAETPMSVSNLHRMAREGTRAIVLIENRQGWLESDVDEWISNGAEVQARYLIMRTTN